MKSLIEKLHEKLSSVKMLLLMKLFKSMTTVRIIGENSFLIGAFVWNKKRENINEALADRKEFISYIAITLEAFVLSNFSNVWFYFSFVSIHYSYSSSTISFCFCLFQHHRSLIFYFHFSLQIYIYLHTFINRIVC